MLNSFQTNVGPYDTEVTIHIVSYRLGAPAKAYGPPESCYDAEDDEIEWEAINEDGSEYTQTTCRECDSIVSAIHEHMEALTYSKQWGNI